RAFISFGAIGRQLRRCAPAATYHRDVGTVIAATFERTNGGLGLLIAIEDRNDRKHPQIGHNAAWPHPLVVGFDRSLARVVRIGRVGALRLACVPATHATPLSRFPLGHPRFSPGSASRVPAAHTKS